MKSNHLLSQIETGISQLDAAVVVEAVELSQKQQIEPELVLKTLVKGLEKVRDGLAGGAVSIPEFLLAIDAFRAGSRRLRELTSETALPPKEVKILIGVVEGDVHDLGKNIVAAVLDACGFEVVDLGREVSEEMIFEGIREHHPSLVALSSMMSTSLENMKQVIAGVKRAYPEMVFLVGGASLDEKTARTIGSDGFAENAMTAPDEASRLVRGLLAS